MLKTPAAGAQVVIADSGFRASFSVNPEAVDIVRELITSRVRLKFTERRKFWSGYTEFKVSGPDEAVIGLLSELEDLWKKNQRETSR